MPSHKYYWLRLQKDFFKRHDIRIIEAMPNGKDYILFYLKLLVESVSHEGSLRFSDTVPYSMEMLATVTDTNVDVVRSAVEIFKELNMVEVMDDATIFMTEVNNMIGAYTGDEHTRESTRERVRRCRERKKQEAIEDKELQSRYSNVTCNGELEIEIELDIDKESKKPTRHKYGEYKHVLLTDEERDRLIKEYGEPVFNEYVAKVDEYCQQKHKSYADYNLTIRKWIRGDKTDKKLANKFVNKDQRAYDFEELEKQFVGGK